MPIAAFRQTVGIAKDSLNTYLTLPAAAAATTVTVASATGITGTSTIFFVDGTLSESRAVTSVAGNVLTVPALTNAHVANCYVYAQPTASIGPANFLPVTGTPAFSDNYAQIDDMGLRGSNVDSYGSTQAAGEGQIAIAGDLIPDVFGYLLGGIFGAVDFTGGSPNTHVFAGMNTAASQGQPTPFVVYYYDGFNTRAFSGSKLSELVIKYDPKGNITWTAKGLGNGSIVVANPTSSFSALVPQVAWTATPTVAGVTLPRLLTADITFKRAQMLGIQTADGTQSPYKIWAGALQATGNLNFVMEDDSDLLNFLNNTQPIVSLAFTTGVGAAQTAMTIQMTKCAFLTGWAPKGGNGGYMEVGGPIKGIANPTDANTAGTGYSPARVTLKNSVATGVYQ